MAAIEFEVAAGVATITLNRPKKLNSIDAEMIGELKQAFRDVARDRKIRAVLLTGAGRGFCAGQDLNERAPKPGQPPRDLGHSLARNYNPLIRAIRELEKPVVAAVNGVAAGAGANIALACDIVLAARSAQFIQAFSRIGLAPDCGGSYHLPLLVGRARALGLTLLGEPLSAEQAADWGMIWKCVDDDALMDEARALVRRLARGPTAGLGLIKRAINRAPDNSLAAQLELEADLQRVAGYTADYREGVAAFIEKRKPRFKGH